MEEFPSVKTTAFTLVVLVLLTAGVADVEGYWCVARSDAADDSLQTALDYACGAGADCAPLEPTGLCFLPNTLQAHASYAFNNFYQRKNGAAGSCDFAGSATLAQTDPSYGSCSYPLNPSTAGLATPPNTDNTPPTTPTTNPYYGTVTPGTSTIIPATGGGPGLNSAFEPSITTTSTTTTTSGATPASRFPLATFVSIVVPLLVV